MPEKVPLIGHRVRSAVGHFAPIHDGHLSSVISARKAFRETRAIKRRGAWPKFTSIKRAIGLCAPSVAASRSASATYNATLYATRITCASLTISGRSPGQSLRDTGSVTTIDDDRAQGLELPSNEIAPIVTLIELFAVRSIPDINLVAPHYVDQRAGATQDSPRPDAIAANRQDDPISTALDVWLTRFRKLDILEVRKAEVLGLIRHSWRLPDWAPL